jgi:hypothetical protein
MQQHDSVIRYQLRGIRLTYEVECIPCFTLLVPLLAHCFDGQKAAVSYKGIS